MTLVDHLIVMTHNTARSAEDDELTNDFVRGVSMLEVLYDHCCHAIVPHSTACLILELSFSQLKVIKQANQSDSAVDQAMWYSQNIVHFLRRARLDLVRHHKGPMRNHLTIEQIIMSSRQLLEEVLPRYSPLRMQLLPSRRSFKGIRRKEAKASGKASAARVQQKRDELKRLPPTEEQWARRQAEYSKGLTKFEQEKAAISAVTDEARILKVILEESVVGQIGTSVAFWSVLKVGALWSNFEAHLPFLFHFSLPHLLALKSRDKTKKAKKALSTEVATSVKGLVAAFLKPRAQKRTDREVLYFKEDVAWNGKPTKHVTLTGSHCKECGIAHSGCVLCFLSAADSRKLEVICGLVRCNPKGALCGKWKASTDLMSVAEERRLGPG